MLAAIVTALVVAVLLVVGLATGGGSDGGATTSGSHRGDRKEAKGQQPQGETPAPSGHSLFLAAKGEVWVCLLNSKGNPLLRGVILGPGDTEGPFRSGSFTLALGNGAMTMTVDGKQANLPEPASPIGFEVRSDGSVRELPEGERPTCT